MLNVHVDCGGCFAYQMTWSLGFAISSGAQCAKPMMSKLLVCHYMSHVFDHIMRCRLAKGLAEHFGNLPQSESGRSKALGSEAKGLVEAWHNVQKPQVNLDARVKEISLDGLCTSCIPASGPTDKPAQLQQAEVDKGVAKPFAFMEIPEFVPPWAAVLSMLYG